VAASGERPVGDFATEALSLKDSPPMHDVIVGYSHDNEGLYVGAVELLELDSRTLSFPSYIQASTFSYCLINHDVVLG
jgi:aspartyl protease family protein